MAIFNSLKRGISIILVVVVVMFGSTFIANSAAAKPTTPEAAAYNFDKDQNSVKAYRKLQKKTYAYRNEGLEGEGSQTGRLGNRVGLAERTGAKLQNRMDQRRDLTSQPSSVEDAAKNMMDNTKDAFQRTGRAARRNLNLDR